MVGSLVWKGFSMSRLVAKSLSYRFASVLVTFVIGYVITGSVAAAVSVGGIDSLFKIGLFAAHEMVWDRIPSGKVAVV